MNVSELGSQPSIKWYASEYVNNVDLLNILI